MGVGHLTEWTHAYEQEETDLAFLSLPLSPKPRFIYLFPCLYISLLLSLEADSVAGVLVTTLPKHGRAGLFGTMATAVGPLQLSFTLETKKVATNSQLRCR